MLNIVSLLEWSNFQVPGPRWQLFEITDLEMYVMRPTYVVASMNLY